MEAVSLFFGIIMMLVAAIGIVLYVALVIAIPVCRLLDWLAGPAPEQVDRRWAAPSSAPSVTRSTSKLAWVGNLVRLALRRPRSIDDA